MPMNTAYLSEGTSSFNAVTAGVISGTSGALSDRLSVGGGRPLTFISGSSTTLVATTAVATKSTTTTFANTLAAVGDIVSWGLGTSTSSLSAGLTLDMFVSAASTITISLSNVSAANAAQAAISLTYAIERLVW